MTYVTSNLKKQMNYKETEVILGNIDIYLIDQILKNRFNSNETILDAGCGEGRNLKWFYKNGYDIFGVDIDEKRLDIAKKSYPKSAHNFKVGDLDTLPYQENYFDHVICCAVLHFAKSEKQFTAMFTELVRVLKHNGILFIRMASNIGLDGNIGSVKDGVSQQNGTYNLTRERIKLLILTFEFELIEPIKTTNVQDLRAMTTLIMKKL